MSPDLEQKILAAWKAREQEAARFVKEVSSPAKFLMIPFMALGIPTNKAVWDIEAQKFIRLEVYIWDNDFKTSRIETIILE